MPTKTTSPAFPLHGGDWIRGTARLTAAERGYYLELLLYTWDTDEPLPDNVKAQMQIARCTDRREWIKVWANLRQKWIKIESKLDQNGSKIAAGFRNRRCEAQRERLRKFHARHSKGGKDGGRDGGHLQSLPSPSPSPKDPPLTPPSGGAEDYEQVKLANAAAMTPVRKKGRRKR